MERYEHGGDIYGNPGVVLDFSVNTNPLGMPEKIEWALISRVKEYARYPDPHCRELRSAIALHEDVPEEAVLCGNGAADLIYRLCNALNPRKALVCAPTFSEYERALEQTGLIAEQKTLCCSPTRPGCQVARHTLSVKNEFALTEDIEEQLTPNIDVLFLCQPNNPTGRLIPMDLLERIICRAQKNRTKIIIDECFLDFTNGVSCKDFLKKTPGLVILKAFTKTYAIAGLRLGYLLTHDSELLNKVSNAAQCWSVSVPAQIAGITALSCDGWQDKTRRFVNEERGFLSGSLTGLGIKVYPSDANFLLLHCEKPLYRPLLEKGVLTRSCENFGGLDASYIRVAVKTHADNIRLIQAVREILNG